ncbi:MAG: flagellar FliJ family protein [Bdellovibrionales bacterium]
MKSLATLIKYQKTLVDEQRLVLARAQDRLEAVAAAIAKLENDRLAEQAAARKDPANAITYGAFVKETIRRREALDKDRQIAEAAVAAARDALAAVFEEQKRYEIAEATRLAAEEKAQDRLETAELDEIGGVTHERRK